MTRRSNCLIYALTAWLKAAPPGEESYLLIRRSRIRWGMFHALHGALVGYYYGQTTSLNKPPARA